MTTPTTTTLSDLLPHVFYINLASRPDRKAHIVEQFKRVGITNYERFDAVKMPSGDGRIGCTFSHLKCLELARLHKYPMVMLCEDDTTFTDIGVFQKQVRLFLNNKKRKWDVLLLAGNNVPPYIKVDDTCVQVSHCQTTTCYLVKEHYYDKLINNIKTGVQHLMKQPHLHITYAIDKFWIQLQRTDKWFLITPLTVIQRDDYSDIEKRNTNYSKLMLDLDKKALTSKAAISGVSLLKMS